MHSSDISTELPTLTLAYVGQDWYPIDSLPEGLYLESEDVNLVDCATTVDHYISDDRLVAYLGSWSDKHNAYLNASGKEVEYYLLDKITNKYVRHLTNKEVIQLGDIILRFIDGDTGEIYSHSTSAMMLICFGAEQGFEMINKYGEKKGIKFLRLEKDTVKLYRFPLVTDDTDEESTEV